MQARGVERRKAIIDAAAEHFADIAKQAGVTTGGLLHHFGSKEALLVEVIRQRDEDALAAVSSLQHDTVADHFEEWLALATWNEAREPYVALHAVLLAESLDPAHPAHDYFAARHRWLLELLAEALQRAVASGELRADLDVDTKAREVEAFIEGAGTTWLFDPVPGELHRLYRSFFDGQLEALRAR